MFLSCQLSPQHNPRRFHDGGLETLILAPPSFRYCLQKANPEQNFLKIIYLKSLSYGLAFLLKLNVSGQIIKRLDWFQS